MDSDLARTDFFLKNGQITYLDVMTGKTNTISRKGGVHAMNNSLTANFNYTFLNGMNLDITSKYNYANNYMVSMALAGTGKATAADGYTYAYDFDGHKAGDVFEGNYNSRYMLRDIGWTRNWMTTAELTGKSKDHAHSWRIGANFWWDRGESKQTLEFMPTLLRPIRLGSTITEVRSLQLIPVASTTTDMRPSLHSMLQTIGR